MKFKTRAVPKVIVSEKKLIAIEAAYILLGEI
jgi:hypothetical protein